VFRIFKYSWLNFVSYSRIKLRLEANQNLVNKAKRLSNPVLCDLTINHEEEITAKAELCFEKFSYYPISFSFPRKFGDFNPDKKYVISKIVPYGKYTFQNSKDYYQEYGKGYLGITHRKGGYDCFRHLEIIASGTVPLFHKSRLIPEFTMIHYPKFFFETIERQYREYKLVPSLKTIGNLTSYANDYLTCRAMCLYFSKMAKLDISQGETILFVDSTLHDQPDYLSVFNFIGLKQVYGSQVLSLYAEPDYVYVDTQIATSSLYGRGFGYTKVLERNSASGIPGNRVKYIVISNLEKDWKMIEDLEIKFPDSHFLLFWGADVGISSKVLELTQNLHSSSLFVREIY